MFAFVFLFLNLNSREAGYFPKATGQAWGTYHAFEDFRKTSLWLGVKNDQGTQI